MEEVQRKSFWILNSVVIAKENHTSEAISSIAPELLPGWAIPVVGTVVVAHPDLSECTPVAPYKQQTKPTTLR
eukprot:scaffold1150_cov152-Amphora_coffeaeformis.AAC.4